MKAILAFSEKQVWLLLLPSHGYARIKQQRTSSTKTRDSGFFSLYSPSIYSSDRSESYCSQTRENEAVYEVMGDIWLVVTGHSTILFRYTLNCWYKEEITSIVTSVSQASIPCGLTRKIRPQWLSQAPPNGNNAFDNRITQIRIWHWIFTWQLSIDPKPGPTDRVSLNLDME